MAGRPSLTCSEPARVPRSKRWRFHGLERSAGRKIYQLALNQRAQVGVLDRIEKSERGWPARRPSCGLKYVVVLSDIGERLGSLRVRERV